VSALQTRDDGQPTVPHYAIADASGREGDTLTFKVTRSGRVSKMVFIAVAAADGTAKAKTDYSTRIAPLLLASGQTSGTVSVRTIAGADVRPARRFTVTLLNLPDSGVADRREATGTILADTPTPPMPAPTPSPSPPPSPRPTSKPSPAATAATNPTPDRVGIADAVGVQEGGTLVFPVARSGAALAAVMLDVVTADGSAAAGRDYRPGRFTVRFAPGQRRAGVSVATLARADTQGARTVVLRIVRAPQGAVIDRASATGSIDDAPDAVAMHPTPTPSPSPSPSPSSSPSSSPTPAPSPSASAPGGDTDHDIGSGSEDGRLFAWLDSAGGWSIAAILAALLAILTAAKALTPFPRPRIRGGIAPAPGRVAGALPLMMPEVAVTAEIAPDLRVSALTILSEEPADD
jgi:hypothetical protein